MTDITNQEYLDALELVQKKEVLILNTAVDNLTSIIDVIQPKLTDLENLRDGVPVNNGVPSVNVSNLISAVSQVASLLYQMKSLEASLRGLINSNQPRPDSPEPSNGVPITSIHP